MVGGEYFIVTSMQPVSPLHVCVEMKGIILAWSGDMWHLRFTLDCRLHQPRRSQLQSECHLRRWDLYICRARVRQGAVWGFVHIRHLLALKPLGWASYLCGLKRHRQRGKVLLLYCLTAGISGKVPCGKTQHVWQPQ